MADNANVSPQTAALSGTGTATPVTDFTTSSTTPPQTITAGASAQYIISVQPAGGAFTGIADSVGNRSAAWRDSILHASIGDSGKCRSHQHNDDSDCSANDKNTPKHWPFLPPSITVALVAPLFWRRFKDRKQRSRHRLLLGTFLFALLAGGVSFITGCGAGFALPSAPHPASTTYTITVTGTSGSDTHSTTVSLIVQ